MAKFNETSQEASLGVPLQSTTRGHDWLVSKYILFNVCSNIKKIKNIYLIINITTFKQLGQYTNNKLNNARSTYLFTRHVLLILLFF